MPHTHASTCMHIALSISDMHLCASSTAIFSWSAFASLCGCIYPSLCEIMCVCACVSRVIRQGLSEGHFSLENVRLAFWECLAAESQGCWRGKLMPAIIACTLPLTVHAATLTYNNVFALKTLRRDHFYLDLGCTIKLWYLKLWNFLWFQMDLGICNI